MLKNGLVIYSLLATGLLIGESETHKRLDYQYKVKKQKQLKATKVEINNYYHKFNYTTLINIISIIELNLLNYQFIKLSVY